MRNNFNKPLKMTHEDEQHFKQTDKCHICNKKYSAKDVRIRDHCHITGKYRGSAHQECNMKLKIKPEDLKIPVIFHNLRGYDSHFIMQQIGQIVKNHAYKNKETKEKHDKKTPSKCITYLDANNLYGWAVSQCLPTGSFRWMTEKEISKINLAVYKEGSMKGLILDVYLEYLQDVHHLHIDYALEPEKE